MMGFAPCLVVAGLAFASPRGSIAPACSQLVAIRSPPPRACDPTATSKPIMDAAMLASVKADLQRVDQGTADAAAIVKEQSTRIASLISQLEERLDQAPSSSLDGTTDGDTAVLHDIVAPHLPLLLGRSFPVAARDALAAGAVRTEGQRGALLALSQYVMGAQQEIADALGTLEWQQAQKVRDLCDAAVEGGTERLIEMATAMKPELDTNFCNYLATAIEAEEARLAKKGLRPFVAPPQVYGSLSAAALSEGTPAAVGAGGAAAALPGAGGSMRVRPAGTTPTARADRAQHDAAETESASASVWRRIVDDDEEFEEEEEEVVASSLSSAAPSSSSLAYSSYASADGFIPVEARPVEPADEAADDVDGGGAEGGSAEEQQWLLVLRVVRRGVYDLLARDYTTDVKHIRYILGLTSGQSRRQLTHSTLLAMNEEQQASFEKTLGRIADNLAVARNARDTEIHVLCVEIQAHVHAYHQAFDGDGQGEFARM